MNQLSIRPRIVENLEEEMHSLLRGVPAPREPQALDYAPPAVRNALPDYVQHRDGVNDIGRLSAGAIVCQYETAAQAVEEMGKGIKEQAARLEAALVELDEDMKMIADTAKAIRDKGRDIFNLIEQSSSITTDVRATCIALREKFASPN